MGGMLKAYFINRLGISPMKSAVLISYYYLSPTAHILVGRI